MLFLRGWRLAVTLCLLCFQWEISLIAAAPPPNDLCSGAEIIPPAGPFPYFSTLLPDISGATDAGDPVLTPDLDCYQIVSRGVWYQFTPAASGFYVLSLNDTATTVHDTLLAVYTSAAGCSGPFSILACNDDAGSLQSAVATNLAAGTTYYVLVWHVTLNAPSPGETAVQLKVSKVQAPVNDLCSGAEIIPAAGPFPYFTSITNSLLATTLGDPVLPSCATITAYRSLWYRFTPATSGVYLFTTVSNTATRVFDTLLGIYTSPGGCAGPFSEFACNDDFTPADIRSALSATLVAGTAYYIVVWDLEQADPGFNSVQLGVWRVGLASALTLPVTSITSTSVTFNALVTPNATNETTSVRFDWGATTGYGNSTPVTTVSSNLVKLLVSTTATVNPVANTIYHCRVVAINSKGTTNGVDRTFVWSNARPQLNALKPLTNGTYRLQFAGNSNQVYRVERAATLPNWLDTGAAADLGTNAFEFIDYDATLFPGSLYRLRAP